MNTFLIACGLIFLAELGDKTQLVALALATRHRIGVTLWGITAATALVHVGSVAIGEAAGWALPAEILTFAAGISFIIFGLWTISGDEDDGQDGTRGRSPFWIVFWTFFIAELGDKTMLGTIAVAAQHPGEPFPVWAGSTLGMVASDALAILAGRLLGKQLPEKAVQWTAASIFLAFGCWGAWEGGHQLPWPAWVAGTAAVAGAAWFFFLRRPDR
ncbi:MAG: TMEM165/GDT1 family protein [Fibrobacteria bacterium]|nr:TMEM165/GDT1 family protein [Fibrobacteria bacterium]